MRTNSDYIEGKIDTRGMNYSQNRTGEESKRFTGSSSLYNPQPYSIIDTANKCILKQVVEETAFPPHFYNLINVLLR